MILLISCNNNVKEKKFTIGFSQCTSHDVWRQSMQKEMERELYFHPEINFILKEAGLNSEKQISQVQELIDQKIDLLIVSPNEAKPITPIVDKAYKEGIPVIVVDRKTLSDNYTAYIGADNYKVGLDAGAFANSILRGKGNVIELGGLQVGSSADIGRHNGFTDYIKNYPGIKYIARIVGDWEKSAWDENFEAFLKTHPDIDLIYCQNDRVALAGYKVCKKLGLDHKLKIIGIDGLSGENGGIDMVEKKEITATILYPTGGKEAIQTAVNILENKPFKKENQLSSFIIDSSNVRMVSLQSQKILSQQSDIERQQNMLEEQIRVFNNQRTFDNILKIALLLVLVLGTTVFFSWRKNKRITQKLQLQNEEISRQSKQLIEVSAKAEEAHQARLNFFTNISHEFRTPLTLIFAPLGELIANTRIQQETKHSLQLIQRNVMRLYRLVNQLMDFRKIEFKKMKPHVSESDIVGFTKEIVDSFKVLAKNKNIDLEFITTERILFVWFDTTMIDKVIFNVLSNAFKFSNDYGLIHVTISKYNGNAIIKIEDDGIGMTRDVIEHAFEPFFQGEYENYKGTGLGLALSKELIELHHGSIAVNSEQRKGASFEIRLPLGNQHFEKSELESSNDKEKAAIIEDADIYTTDLYNIRNIPEQSFGAILPKYLTVLVVEDNNEMRDYLASRLGTEYNVIEAADSKTAINAAFDAVPDLILCDIVIPGKNGLELTAIFKSDVRTAHIPVILLTAKDQDYQKIEGMETQADAYITKPFNLLFLQKTIKSLLQNREKIKDHYSGEIFSEEKSQVSKKEDRKFIIDFAAIVENNIGNEKFGVNDICNELGISRVQLYRKVKTVLNCSVNDYIIDTRLQKAKYYMQHENLSISEIAYKSGFSSAAYFSTVFKSKFGVTPSAFKEG
jgi:signal transduction histidine kinase/DNA-binding response OmpR family regulator